MGMMRALNRQRGYQNSGAHSHDSFLPLFEYDNESTAGGDQIARHLSTDGIEILKMWLPAAELAQDLKRFDPNARFSWPRLIATAARQPGLAACLLFRLQAALHAKGHGRTASWTRGINLSLTGADFVPGCVAGPGLLIRHPNGLVVGEGVRIGAECTLLHQVTLGERYVDGRAPHLYPVLGNRVTVGAGAKVLGGVTLGDDCVIGANAVVTHDVPSGRVAVGIPARVIPEVNAC